ncbi:Hypothetical protein (Fragment) [Durusdinium trenchii]|uniref:Uncharacterized protein n=1 Tax=Durusdinium trenchii TaxID=1381693 RepID=A0ABP0H8E5_9DINO
MASPQLDAAAAWGADDDLGLSGAEDADVAVEAPAAEMNEAGGAGAGELGLEAVAARGGAGEELGGWREEEEEEEEQVGSLGTPQRHAALRKNARGLTLTPTSTTSSTTTLGQEDIALLSEHLANVKLQAEERAFSLNSEIRELRKRLAHTETENRKIKQKLVLASPQMPPSRLDFSASGGQSRESDRVDGADDSDRDAGERHRRQLRFEEDDDYSDGEEMLNGRRRGSSGVATPEQGVGSDSESDRSDESQDPVAVLWEKGNQEINEGNYADGVKNYTTAARLLATNHAAAEAQVSSLSAQLEELQTECKVFVARDQESRRENEALKKEFGQMQSETAARVDEVLVTLADRDGTIASLREELAQARQAAELGAQVAESLETYEARLQEYQSRVEQHEQQAQDLQTQHEAELERIRAAHTSELAELEILRSQDQQHEEQLSELQDEVTRLTTVDADRQELQAKLEATEESLEKNKDLLRQLKRRYEKLKHERDEASQVAAESQPQPEQLVQLEKQVETLNGEVAKYQQVALDAHHSLELAQAEQAELQQTLGALQDQFSTLQEENAELVAAQQRPSELESEAAAAERRVADAKEKLNEARTRCMDAEVEAEGLRNQHEKTQAELRDKVAELEALRGMESDLHDRIASLTAQLEQQAQGHEQELQVLRDQLEAARHQLASPVEELEWGAVVASRGSPEPSAFSPPPAAVQQRQEPPHVQGTPASAAELFGGESDDDDGWLRRDGVPQGESSMGAVSEQKQQQPGMSLEEELAHEKTLTELKETISLRDQEIEVLKQQLAGVASPAPEAVGAPGALAPLDKPDDVVGFFDTYKDDAGAGGTGDASALFGETPGEAQPPPAGCSACDAMDTELGTLRETLSTTQEQLQGKILELEALQGGAVEQGPNDAKLQELQDALANSETELEALRQQAAALIQQPMQQQQQQRLEHDKGAVGYFDSAPQEVASDTAALFGTPPQASPQPQGDQTELAALRSAVEIKDAEVEELRELVATKDAELEALRAASAPVVDSAVVSMGNPGDVAGLFDVPQEGNQDRTGATLAASSVETAPPAPPADNVMLEKELLELRQTLQSKDAELVELEARLAALHTRASELEGDLQAKITELETVRATLPPADQNGIVPMGNPNDVAGFFDTYKDDNQNADGTDASALFGAGQASVGIGELEALRKRTETKEAELKQLQEQHAVLEKTTTELHGDLQSKVAQLQASENQAESLRDQLAQRTAELADVQNRVEAIVTDRDTSIQARDNLEEELGVAREKAEYLETQLREQTDNQFSEENKLRNLVTELEGQVRAARAEAAQASASLEAELQECKESLVQECGARKRAEEDLEDAKSRLGDAQGTLSENEEKLATLLVGEKRRVELEKRKAELELELESLHVSHQEDVAQLESKIQEQLAAEQTNMDDLLQRLSDAEASNQELEAQVRELTDRSRALLVENDALKEVSVEYKELQTKFQRLREENVDLQAKVRTGARIEELEEELVMRDKALLSLSHRLTKLMGVSKRLQHERDRAQEEAASMFHAQVSMEMEERSSGLRRRSQSPMKRKSIGDVVESVNNRSINTNQGSPCGSVGDQEQVLDESATDWDLKVTEMDNAISQFVEPDDVPVLDPLQQSESQEETEQETRNPNVHTEDLLELVSNLQDCCAMADEAALMKEQLALLQASLTDASQRLAQVTAEAEGYQRDLASARSQIATLENHVSNNHDADAVPEPSLAERLVDNESEVARLSAVVQEKDQLIMELETQLTERQERLARDTQSQQPDNVHDKQQLRSLQSELESCMALLHQYETQAAAATAQGVLRNEQQQQRDMDEAELAESLSTPEVVKEESEHEIGSDGTNNEALDAIKYERDEALSRIKELERELSMRKSLFGSKSPIVHRGSVVATNAGEDIPEEFRPASPSRSPHHHHHNHHVSFAQDAASFPSNPKPRGVERLQGPEPHGGEGDATANLDSPLVMPWSDKWWDDEHHPDDLDLASPMIEDEAGDTPAGTIPQQQPPGVAEIAESDRTSPTSEGDSIPMVFGASPGADSSEAASLRSGAGGVIGISSPGESSPGTAASSVAAPPPSQNAGWPQVPVESQAASAQASEQSPGGQPALAEESKSPSSPGTASSSKSRKATEPRFMSRMFGIGKHRRLIEAGIQDENSDFDETEERDMSVAPPNPAPGSEMSDPFKAAREIRSRSRSRTLSNFSARSTQGSGRNTYPPFELQQHPTGIISDAAAEEQQQQPLPPQDGSPTFPPQSPQFQSHQPQPPPPQQQPLFQAQASNSDVFGSQEPIATHSQEGGSPQFMPQQMPQEPPASPFDNEDYYAPQQQQSQVLQEALHQQQQQQQHPPFSGTGVDSGGSVENFGPSSPLESSPDAPVLQWNSVLAGASESQVAGTEERGRGSSDGDECTQDSPVDVAEILSRKAELERKVADLEHELEMERQARIWRERQLCTAESELQKAAEANHELKEQVMVLEEQLRNSTASLPGPERPLANRPPPLDTGASAGEPERDEKQEEMQPPPPPPPPLPQFHHPQQIQPPTASNQTSGPPGGAQSLEQELEWCKRELAQRTEELREARDAQNRLELSLTALNEQLKAREDDYEYLVKNLALSIYARSKVSPSSALQGSVDTPLTPRSRKAVLEGQHGVVVYKKRTSVQNLFSWTYYYVLPHTLLVLTTFLISVGTPPEVLDDLIHLRRIIPT